MSHPPPLCPPPLVVSVSITPPIRQLNVSCDQRKETIATKERMRAKSVGDRLELRFVVDREERCDRDDDTVCAMCVFGLDHTLSQRDHIMAATQKNRVCVRRCFHVVYVVGFVSCFAPLYRVSRFGENPACLKCRDAA